MEVVAPHVPSPEWTSAYARPPGVRAKRRAHERDWDADEDAGPSASTSGVVLRVKKCRTAGVEEDGEGARSRSHSPPNTPPPSPPLPVEHVISIIVDALTIPAPSLPDIAMIDTPPPPPPSPPPAEPPPSPPSTEPPPPSPASPESASRRNRPTSPLSDLPQSERARFVRKLIGGACAGRSEPSLTRWVLSRRHFLSVRALDPNSQSTDWVQTLHAMGWHELHPFYQQRSTFSSLSAFSKWIEDEFDYEGDDGDADGAEWSDDDDDAEDADDDPARGVWDSGVVLQFPPGPAPEAAPS